MRKYLAIWTLGLVLIAGVGFAEDPIPAATVRIAIVRDAPSLEKTIQSVFECRYEGNIRVVQTSAGKFAAINTLNVEDYLTGVVGREMSPTCPLEALKAQAIAARTHALFQAEDSPHAPYDLVANLSQAYRGIDRRASSIARAVSSTRNEVIVFKGRLVPTLFHASCGGHTANMGEVWETAMEKTPLKAPAMPGVYCAACAETAHFNWVADLTHSSFTKKVKSSGSKIGELVRVEVLGRTPSGRVSKVQLVGTLGSETLSAEKLRQLIGYNVLRSGFFDVEKTSNGILFRGDGWGHGVGLCQYGAQQMAERGATYQEILRHFFPGCKIVSYEPSSTYVAWLRCRAEDLH